MQIALTSSGDFLLTYPSGRDVIVPNSPHSSDFLYRILYYATSGRVNDNGRVAYPAQSIIDQWTLKARREALAQDEERLQQVAEETAQKYGIALSELDLTL